MGRCIFGSGLLSRAVCCSKAAAMMEQVDKIEAMDLKNKGVGSLCVNRTVSLLRHSSFWINAKFGS
jgi:hypothetical protein